MLGGRPGNHGGCGERSGGCERRARSSLLRRACRHASSVVAALAALAPRLVHGYPDRLLMRASLRAPGMQPQLLEPELEHVREALRALGERRGLQQGLLVERLDVEVLGEEVDEGLVV